MVSTNHLFICLTETLRSVIQSGQLWILMKIVERNWQLKSNSGKLVWCTLGKRIMHIKLYKNHGEIFISILMIWAKQKKNPAKFTEIIYMKKNPCGVFVDPHDMV